MATEKFIPYCGSAPVPGALQWNLDPVLIAVLGVLALVYAARFRSGRGVRDKRLALGLTGWLVLGGALVTPLCNLSVALFAARAAQHVLILLVAAPLLILGQADTVIGLGRVGRRENFLAPAIFAGVLWFWHMPPFYDATLQNNAVYWAMHISMLGAALGLWRVLLRNGGLLGSLFTGAQMGALGAILTLSPRPWFAVHAATTWPWGLSQLTDQQLGGVIMWIVGGVVVGTFTIAAFARGLANAGRPVPAS
jgi:putative membrane protein